VDRLLPQVAAVVREAARRTKDALRRNEAPSAKTATPPGKKDGTP